MTQQNTRRGFTQIKRGGFTLIELLVVVLIIGILAAVAVPQYQKAVMKSRIMSVVAYLKAVQEAEEIHYLDNGTYTDDINSLSIDGPCPNGWTCRIVNSKNIQVYYNGNPALRVIAPFKHAWMDKRIYCAASPSDAWAVSLCKSMGPDVGSDTTLIRHAISN